MIHVPILMYHSVTDRSSRETRSPAVRPSAFVGPPPIHPKKQTQASGPATAGVARHGLCQVRESE
jgi:hypothetical protein